MILSYRDEDGGAVKGVAAPLRVDGQRTGLRLAPPGLGQHSASILSELGYSEDATCAMIRSGVVGADRNATLRTSGIHANSDA